MARCTGQTKGGRRCAKNASPGRETCPVHHPEGNANPGAPRPSDLTFGDLERNLERIRIGFLESGTLQGAARKAGVHRATLSAWMGRGRQDRADRLDPEWKGDPTATPHMRLLEILEDAKDELVAELAAQYQARAIADGDLKAIHRLLAVHDPDTWAERREVRHAGVADAPPISISGPPPVIVTTIALGTDLAAEAERIAAGDDAEE